MTAEQVIPMRQRHAYAAAVAAAAAYLVLSSNLRSCGLLLSLQQTQLPLLLHTLLPPPVATALTCKERQLLERQFPISKLMQHADWHADRFADWHASKLPHHTYQMSAKQAPPGTPPTPAKARYSPHRWRLALPSALQHQTTQDAASSTARCQLTEAASSRPVHTHKPAAQPGTGSAQRQP
jgi:hypothetical protein